MAINTRSALTTVENVMEFIASYAGGIVPPTNDDEHTQWILWIALGQQDAANRGFWRRLLTSVDLEIKENEATADLPDNFHKINGIYSLTVDEINWAQPNNTAGVKLFVEIDPDTAAWRVRFYPTPTSDYTGLLWYYFNPPKPVSKNDILYLDGEMIGFYALTEYFRKLKQMGSQDDARIEYQNRFNELLNLEMIPSPQELVSFVSYDAFRNVGRKDTQYYPGRRGRSR